uniref:uncharacterized protein K02A2.6-like n=1 Tax=Styela clava TaxID=7725 RepID=UPI00193A56FA|nr:uncharacterized protein K02A2.6-like [Styela clava]
MAKDGEKLDLQRAFQNATSMELANRDVAEISSVSGMPMMKEHYFSRKQRFNTLKCKHCGKTAHDFKNCRYKNFQCFNCGRRGHIQQVCLRRKPVMSRERTGNDRRDNDKARSANVMENDSSDSPNLENSSDSSSIEYSDVFSGDVGCIKGTKAKLVLKKGAIPKFFPPRPVPFALRPKIEAELKRLERDDIITKVTFSEWATPIVPVLKKDGKIRLCADFKVTVNPVLCVDQYPLHTIDDLFTSLAGGQKFSKIDLKQAYLQMEVEEESKELLTVNTHKGLYRFNRLPFGIASAPAIWQRTIEQILNGVPRSKCILDDMLTTGIITLNIWTILKNNLMRLQQYNLKVNKSKTEFFKNSVEFCGYKVDCNGLHKTDAKIKAIRDAPRPENVSQVRSFIGMVNYYQRFIPNLSSVLYPLNCLLRANCRWKWTKYCEKAFLEAKKLMTSSTVLTHYDPSLTLKLASDASQYGLGAVMSHVMKDGSERPIAFASKSLTETQRKYSQIEKEALAIIWGVKKFYCYVCGRKFTLVTDHRPLTSIFHPNKGIPATTAARLQRYALFLAGLDYEIEFKPTAKHCNADGLSRMPLQAQENETEDDITDATVNSFAICDSLPITCKQVRNQTCCDADLMEVYDSVMKGWSLFQSQKPSIKPYYFHKREITAHDGCLMWGSRVIIPNSLRSRLLKELHDGHVGIVKMKSLARSYFWWPGLDKDIENMIKNCNDCQMQQNEPSKAPLHHWEWPQAPWIRVHVDFAGWKRHIDQIIKSDLKIEQEHRYEEQLLESEDDHFEHDEPASKDLDATDSAVSKSPVPSPNIELSPPNPPIDQTPETDESQNPTPTKSTTDMERRYPLRQRRRPDRF